MKIKSVELIENASNVEQASQSRALLAETHEFELLENGWLRWRSKKGPWRQSPPSMIRNIEELQNVGSSEEVPMNRNIVADGPTISTAPVVLPEQTKRRGRPPKQ